MSPDQCGKCGYCCSYMGDVFGIVEQQETFKFRIQYLITGVQQEVTIDPDKRELFLNNTILEKRPLACPFLREKLEGLVVCTVYASRPELCRIYLCPKCKST